MLALRCLSKRYSYLCGNGAASFSSCCETQKNVIQQYYKDLNLPHDANQEMIKEAFIKMAKKYHPDSGSPEASSQKFCLAEQAFRELSKHKSGTEVDSAEIIFDIKHTAPQHRQYLNYDGVGCGSPYQREKYWAQLKAHKAAQNVFDHKIAKASASENTLEIRGKSSRKTAVDKVFGLEDVEEVILEAISKGEFDNLKGSGEPLKPSCHNPFVDFTTQKMNDYLINNGFKPGWVALNKEIRQHTIQMKEELVRARSLLGPYPLSNNDEKRWHEICKEYKEKTKKINRNILTYNLIVPILNKQRLALNFDTLSGEILRKGPYKRKVSTNILSENFFRHSEKDLVVRLIESATDFLFKWRKKSSQNCTR